MKKCLAMIMAMVLMLSMSTVAFAERIDNGVGDEGKDVKLNVTKAGTVYKIDLEWGSTDFTYNLHAGTWQADTHTYSGGDAGWVLGSGQTAVKDGGGNTTGVATTITATNNSNAVVYVQAAYAAAAYSNGTVASELVGALDGKVQENLDDASKYIDDWTSGTPANCTCKFTFQVTGTPTEAADDVTVGTITVTISEAPFV